MQKRIRRAVLGSVTVVGLFASVALAGPGPGGYTNGDPDTPHFMKPKGQAMAASEGSGGYAAPGSEMKVVSDPSQERWMRILQKFANLQRFFVL